MRLTVIFFDTNVLVYFAINQDSKKQDIAQTLIQQAVEKQALVISPLVMIELIFVLSKLNQLIEQEKTVSFFQQFVKGQIAGDLVLSAYQLCAQHGYGKNINDVIHLKFAEKHCDKIVTFDTDFKALQPFSTIKIEIQS
jgi:predicted nucleic acid-binding protein